MKPTAIVTGGTKNMVPAMAVLALNIAEVCPDIADILVIFHDGISEKEQKKINSIFPTRFIFYKSPFSNINDFSNVITNYFNQIVFCKYECFKLLNEYRTVIWTDYDILILKNISELKNKNQISCFMPDTHISSLKDMFYPSIESSVFPQEYLKRVGICTPLFILHDTIPDYSDIYNECISLTKKFSVHLYLPEQCIFSYIIFEHNIEYYAIPYVPYCSHPVNDTISDETFIIHAYGQPKFWNGQYNSIWESYYKTWIKKYHGTEFDCRIKQKISVKILTFLLKLLKCIVPYGLIVIAKRIKRIV